MISIEPLTLTLAIIDGQSRSVQISRVRHRWRLLPAFQLFFPAPVLIDSLDSIQRIRCSIHSIDPSLELLRALREAA